jgi:hypothetical protein
VPHTHTHTHTQKQNLKLFSSIDIIRLTLTLRRQIKKGTLHFSGLGVWGPQFFLQQGKPQEPGLCLVTFPLSGCGQLHWSSITKG